MRIRVVAFATAADALGSRRLELELSEGARLGDLAEELIRRQPDLGAIWERLALAVDGQLATPGHALTDGCEVALLPPVSGGAPSRIRLVEGAIDLAALVAASSSPRRGATVIFTGSVRDRRGDRRVTQLTYEGYAAMAKSALERICDELESATDELRLTVSHRLGPVPVGEASVAIVASAPHRAAAFDACRTVLERLKREVAIWKREHYADGSAQWREEERLGAAGGAPRPPAQ